MLEQRYINVTIIIIMIIIEILATNLSEVFCKNCVWEKVTFDRGHVMNLNVTGDQLRVGSIIHGNNLFAENYTVYILVRVCEMRIKCAENILVDIIITRQHLNNFCQ